MPINSESANVNIDSVLQKTRLKASSQVTDPKINRKPDMNYKPLGVLLSQFESHGLDEINNAGLMYRVDTKYLLPVSELEKLLLLLAPFYTVLEIDFRRLFSYRNTYFDTPEFGFYLMHHNGKQDRFKIRQRLYVESGDMYVEVKHKTNKRVTQKDRVLIDGHSGSEDRINELISKPFGGSRPPLFKSLVCSYVRIALADEKNGERLTLDVNLSFKDPNLMRIEQPNQVLIAEVKRENHKVPSVFIDLMDRYRQKPVSFSKYCIGCALIHSNRIKTNRFKATLMSLARTPREKTGIAA
jgi:VTC domain